MLCQDGTNRFLSATAGQRGFQRSWDDGLILLVKRSFEATAYRGRKVRPKFIGDHRTNEESFGHGHNF